jgi:hypothetical protein
MTDSEDRLGHLRLLGAVGEISSLLKLVEERADALADVVTRMPTIRSDFEDLAASVKQTRERVEALRKRAQDS